MNWLFKLILVAAISTSIATSANANSLTPKASQNHGGKFTLQSLQGPVSLDQFQGQVVLMFFGFTSCPDVCPTALANISRAFNQLNADELVQVDALFVSLDPERDNVELLSKYTGYFHNRIVGATGQIETVSQMAGNYGIKFKRRLSESSPIGYVIDHSPDILIINRNGQLLESRITPQHDTGEIVSFVRSLLDDG